jgi:hypothetical protein
LGNSRRGFAVRGGQPASISGGTVCGMHRALDAVRPRPHTGGSSELIPEQAAKEAGAGLSGAPA